MPIFEFHCEHCGSDFESIMKPYDPVQCAQCKSIHVVRLMSLPSNKGFNTIKNPALAESERKAGKADRMAHFNKYGKFG